MESFADYCVEWTASEASSFIDQALNRMADVGDFDRSRRNLASLVLSVSCVYPPSREVVIEDISLDEVYLLHEIDNIIMKSVSINQLYARETDLRQLVFDENCFIVSLIADQATFPSLTLPLPSFISLHDKTLINEAEKTLWLRGQLDFNPVEQLSAEFFEAVVPTLPLFELLTKVARTKTYWIKDDPEDRAARRILDDEYWETLKQIMMKHGLLTTRTVPSSGRPGAFYHVRKRQSLLNIRTPPADLMPFFREVFDVSLRIIRELAREK